MKLPTEPYKGVRDFYPEDEAVQKFMFDTMRRVVEKCGYVEYNASVLEPAELYKAKGAENEELANEQTYTFLDRGERQVTLRPEMTPTVARMVAAKRRELAFPLRWYSIQNFFRYERPQRGRVREFWQLNIDLFGSNSLYADAEIIGVAYGILIAFGAKESDFVIRVGSRTFLDSFAQERGLSEEQMKKLRRLLDAREKMPRQEYEAGLAELGIEADAFDEVVPPEDISKMLAEFKKAGIGNIVYDPSIVRGFDYYTGTVFEVYDTDPQNKRALFGGGRYDNLLSLFGDEKIPAVGFGMGDVTLRDFLEVRGLIPQFTSTARVYIAVTEPELALDAQTLAGELRRAGINAAIDFGDKKLGDQIKTADKQRIPYLIVVGRDELASREFAVKELATHQETKTSRKELPLLLSGQKFFLDKK